VLPVDPQSAEFAEQLAAVGAQFGAAEVDAIYCVHGTFVGNDVLGMLTELSRFAPALSRQLSRVGKRVIDVITGEAGNYTREFTAALESGLAAGAGRTTPVRLFHWSSQNNHIARADGAIGLIDELARAVTETPQFRRAQLWGHSHGGNVLALVTQLLAADRAARDDFFDATRSFYQGWIRGGVDMPRWQSVRQLLDEPEHPIRKLSLDIVTFGTPIRYGWSAGGYAKLLHFIHHRPPPGAAEYETPWPPRLQGVRRARYGDCVQQVGIAGTNFPPLPIAVRTLLADWRLSKLLEQDIASEFVLNRLRARKRVPDEGTTLLIDYGDIHPWLVRHLAGHGLYTWRKWLPFHCQQIAEQFYESNVT